MVYVLIGFIILVTVLAHELGHLIAMRKCGVWVTELGIGLPWGPRFGWTFASRTHDGKTFRISLYPLLLLGAFVRPENEKSMERLSYHDQAFISGAGIIGNLVFIALAIALIGALIPDGRSVTLPIPPFGMIAVTNVFLWYGILAAGLILWCARLITQYIFPAASVLTLYWIVTLLMKLSFGEFVQNSGGIVAIAQIGEAFSKNTVALIYYSILVSYLLALTNILPVYPLDGGRTMKLLGEKYFPRTWIICEKVGIAFFLFLVVFALAGDIRRIMDLFY